MKTQNKTNMDTKSHKKDKRWNTKESISVLLTGILIGVIVTYIGILIGNYISDTREENKLNFVKPEIDIEIQELAKNKLFLSINSMKVKGSIIDKLYFKFHIPGVYSHYQVQYQDKIESFDLKSNMHTRHKNITTSETITFEGGSFYSGGTLNLYIYFEPTQIIKDQYDYLTLINFPLLDLHDYLPFYFYWNYNGNTLTESGAFNLDYLDYIRKDNLILISHETHVKRSIKDQLNYSPDHPISLYIKNLKYDKTKRFVVPINSTGITIDTLFIYNDSLDTKSLYSGLYKNYDDVKKMEEERKNWY